MCFCAFPMQAMIPAGPYQQFLGCDIPSSTWRGSLAIVLPPLGPADQQHPLLTFIDEGTALSLICMYALQLRVYTAMQGIAQ